MKFILGLRKITKGHTAIRVVVGCCTHKLAHVTLDKVSTLWGIGETFIVFKNYVIFIFLF